MSVVDGAGLVASSDTINTFKMHVMQCGNNGWAKNHVTTRKRAALNLAKNSRSHHFHMTAYVLEQKNWIRSTTPAGFPGLYRPLVLVT